MPVRKFGKETEHFHNFLRRRGKKKTYQKDLILETFLKTEGHLSVEDVYALVKKKDKKIGVVTVFRTLLSLADEECGIARKINLGDGLTRFEHRFQHPYHHHIICNKCHKAIEFVCPELDRIQDEIIRKYSFTPDHHRFQTYGICEDCRENKHGADNSNHDTEKIFARDALRMALTMKNNCLDFFKAAARCNMDPGGKAIFERMILDEEKHISDLNANLDDLLRQEDGLDRAPVFLHFDPGELGRIIPDISDYENRGEVRLDSKAAIELAATMNLCASEFFKKYAEKFTDTLGKRILMNFAVREERHGGLMKQRMEDRMHPGMQ
ncbi:MAG: transcriptional repressor [Acidobacteria bacterium]|nr:transcriptional repressor [Acidobacteriota bacterium]